MVFCFFDLVGYFIMVTFLSYKQSPVMPNKFAFIPNSFFNIEMCHICSEKQKILIKTHCNNDKNVRIYIHTKRFLNRVIGSKIFGDTL